MHRHTLNVVLYCDGTLWTGARNVGLRKNILEREQLRKLFMYEYSGPQTNYTYRTKELMYKIYV